MSLLHHCIDKNCWDIFTRILSFEDVDVNLQDRVFQDYLCVRFICIRLFRVYVGRMERHHCMSW